MREQILTMPDGRVVGFAEYGVRGGTPVIWCHGGPGCRREPEYFSDAAAEAGLRIVGIDRPGYGLSTPQPERTIGGWATDAFAVADRLGIERFATVGVSTGGAYALALAALAPDRVLATLACCAVTDMRWAEGRAMMPLPRQIWDAPNREAALAIVTAQLGAHGENVSNSMNVMPLAASDTALFAVPEWARNWSSMVAEWFTYGVDGYTDDRIADGAGWHTFDVRRIACPVAVVHGTSDTLAPVEHAHYTQRIVPGAVLDTREGLGHFSILPEVVPALSALLRGSRSARRRTG
jgi:pimeloyl-ACP methyl ester carboxylesterase